VAFADDYDQWAHWFAAPIARAWREFLERIVPAEGWLQNGFPTPSDATIAWDDATRTLTLAPAVDSFDYYIAGRLYTETGSLTETITDDEGLWAFYIDSEGSIASVKNPTESEIDTVIETASIIAYVYWDDTNNDGRLMYEIHGSNMAPATHHWIHDNMGAQYKEGMGLADFVISDGSDNEDAQFSITEGEFYDEDIEHEIAAVGKTTGVEIWYLIGSDWRWETNAGFSILTVGSGRMAWNDAGSQTEVALNKYALCHIFGTNITADDGTGPTYISIQGQATYNSKLEARAGADTEINNLVYGSFPLEEVVPIATVIFQSGAYGNAVKSRVVTTDSGDNWVDWRTSSVKGTGGSIADHGALAGLGDDDHQLYLLAADATDRTTFATDWGDLTDAGQTSLHSHAVGATTDDYSDISDNDGATNVTGAELEELTDASETALHSHAGGAAGPTTDDYSDISDNDAATDVTGAELEELTDASETTLHSHAASGDLADLDDVTITSVANNEILSYDLGGDWINQTPSELQMLGAVAPSISPDNGDVIVWSVGSGLWLAEAPSGGSSKEYASFYLSTGGVTAVAGTETTLVVNATSVNSDGAIFSLSSNQVTVNKSADFEVSFQVSFNSGGTARTSYGIWLDRDAATEAGTYTETYQRGYDSGGLIGMLRQKPGHTLKHINVGTTVAILLLCLLCFQLSLERFSSYEF